MKLNELKSELKEKEKGCGRKGNCFDNLEICGKDIQDTGLWICPICKAEISTLKKGISACEETINEYEKYLDDYKKEQRDLIGEEILNRQQIKKDSSEGSNTNYLETQSTTEEVNKQECKSGCVDNQSADTPTLIKQGNFNTSMNRKVCYEAGYRDALSQRNKEILEIIERMMSKKEDETDVQIWGEELKSKLQEGNKQ